jgi:methionyl-tRNA synthetase
VRAVSFGQDGNVTIDSLHERYERELANDLGNLVSRTTAMIARYRDGRITVAPGESNLSEAIAAVRREVPARLDVFDLTGAIDVIWDLVRGLNRHVEQTKPWELAKDEARADELTRVLYELADGLRVAAVALSPYLPRTAPQILRALGQSEDLGWEQVEEGRTIAAEGIEPATPLFPRVDQTAAA